MVKLHCDHPARRGDSVTALAIGDASSPAQLFSQRLTYSWRGHLSFQATVSVRPNHGGVAHGRDGSSSGNRLLTGGFQ